MNVIVLSAPQTPNVSMALAPTSVCAKWATQVCFCLNVRPTGSQARIACCFIQFQVTFQCGWLTVFNKIYTWDI